ncbi:MAG: hypothetical protein E7122_02590 [Bacteroidales bacterium]|nr:hypothetical protein [Bacteroidales bacterium]
MQRSLLLIILLLCSSCAATLKTQAQRQQLDIAMTALDSLNTVITIKDLQKEIQKIEDNSRIKVTKYSPPDSSGNQAIDYIMEIERDTRQENTVELKKDEIQEQQQIHQEVSTDSSIIATTDKYEEPPAIRGIKHIKGIIALILIAYIIYKFKRN